MISPLSDSSTTIWEFFSKIIVSCDLNLGRKMTMQLNFITWWKNWKSTRYDHRGCRHFIIIKLSNSVIIESRILPGWAKNISRSREIPNSNINILATSRCWKQLTSKLISLNCLLNGEFILCFMHLFWKETLQKRRWKIKKIADHLEVEERKQPEQDIDSSMNRIVFAE